MPLAAVITVAGVLLALVLMVLGAIPTPIVLSGVLYEPFKTAARVTVRWSSLSTTLVVLLLPDLTTVGVGPGPRQEPKLRGTRFVIVGRIPITAQSEPGHALNKANCLSNSFVT